MTNQYDSGSRRRLGLSLDEVAAMAGVTVESVKSIEENARSLIGTVEARDPFYMALTEKLSSVLKAEAEKQSRLFGEKMKRISQCTVLHSVEHDGWDGYTVQLKFGTPGRKPAVTVSAMGGTPYRALLDAERCLDLARSAFNEIHDGGYLEKEVASGRLTPDEARGMHDLPPLSAVA